MTTIHKTGLARQSASLGAKINYTAHRLRAVKVSAIFTLVFLAYNATAAAFVYVAPGLGLGRYAWVVLLCLVPIFDTLAIPVLFIMFGAAHVWLEHIAYCQLVGSDPDDHPGEAGTTPAEGENDGLYTRFK